MSKQEFKQEHMMNLQGKEYLPVAPRVVMFRKDNPDWSIQTEVTLVGDDHYVVATVYRPVTEIKEQTVHQAFVPMASAHKRVRKNAKGPAAQWPLETAETGAIGRALALCGYGTMAGDLDEGEELADAPVEAQLKKTTKKRTTKKSKSKVADSDVDSFVVEFDGCEDVDVFDDIYKRAVRWMSENLPASSLYDEDDYKTIKSACDRARKRLGIQFE